MEVHMSSERKQDKVYEATNEKLRCPTCGDELYKIKSKYVCANEGCDYQSLSNQFISSVIPWNLNSSAEENYWKEAVFEKYPYIIATEYRRLFDLLIENKLYGMIFQIKDVFEIILKLPTLLCLNRMIINKSRSKDENEIIAFFVSKMLSLGDWHSIARKCVLLTDDEALRTILQDVVKIYDKHHIVKWRNDTIGHGALMFDNTEEFREDLIHKLTLLKKHFDNCNQQYVDFQLSYKTKKDTIELKGANVKRHLLSSKGTIVWGKTEVQDLILVDNKELYFFDSYLSRESKTKLLNYIDAKIIKKKLKNVEVIYRNIPKELLAESDSSSIFDDGIYAESEVEMLNYISKSEQLITPEYLKAWLSNQLENHKKGIFLIQMEEGMGKTTFSRLLDPHVSGKIKLQNISVRSYYVNSTYSYKLDMFQNDVIDLLKSNNDKSDRLKGNLPIFNSNSKMSTRKKFANILNEYQSVYSRKFGSEKLLFIIDGLDEIPELSSDSIFDYIPNYEDLSENIYILLTSRVHDENLSLLNSKIDKINLTNRVEYNRNYESYTHVLHQFIRKQMKISNEELITEIIKHSHSRFSYIKPIEKIMKYRENDNILEADVFEEFIDLLKENYSSKYFNQLIYMISMLAVSRDGLSISEISYLLNSKRADFKLLAYIADINSLLTTKRTYRGTVIALSHYSLKKVYYRELSR